LPKGLHAEVSTSEANSLERFNEWEWTFGLYNEDGTETSRSYYKNGKKQKRIKPQAVDE
jgi:hypothetical protein